MFSLLRSFIFFTIILQPTSSQATHGEVPRLPQLRDEKTTTGDGEGRERVPEPQPRKLSSYRGLRSFNYRRYSSRDNRDQTHPSSNGHHRRSDRNEVLPSMSFRSSGGGGGGGGGKGGGGGSKGGGGSSKGGGSGGKKSGGKTGTSTGSTSTQSGHQSSGDHNKAHTFNYLFPIFLTSLFMLGVPFWN